MKKFLLTIVFSIGLVSMLNAQWVSPGDGTIYIMDNLVELSNGCVTWDQTNSIYYIHNDITISANDKLFLNKDDKLSYIEFDDNYILTIKGSIEAHGTNENSYLVFRMNGHIRIEDTTDPNMFTCCYFYQTNGIQIINSEVVFDTCAFAFCHTQQQNSVVDFLNCNPVFTNCHFHYNEGAAISSPANGQGSPQIIDCLFCDNVTESINVPQINLGPGAEDTIYMIGNRVIFDSSSHAIRRAGGISIADLIGVGSTKVLMKNNSITGGRYGYNQQGKNISSVIDNNYFHSNSYSDNAMNGGSGISIYGIDENNKAKLRNNKITNNRWGITVINAADVDLGTMDDWGYNEIHGNDTSGIINGGVIFDLYNNSNCDIMAIGNDWGTNKEHYIEYHIFHKHDNSSLGLVTFVPFIGDDNVNESTTAAFEISPNPISNGMLNLTFKDATPFELTIYNIKGQIVATQHIDNQIYTINIESLKSGIYFVEARNETRKLVKKIIIE